MSVVVTTKEELKSALKIREDRIIVKGSLAKKIKPLSIIKKPKEKISIHEGMSQGMAVASLSLAGISTVVAITLIVTVGIVAIVAILNNYRVAYKDGDVELTLEPN